MAQDVRFLNDDIVHLSDPETGKKGASPTLFWGDAIRVVEPHPDGGFLVDVGVKGARKPKLFRLPAKASFRKNGVLKVRFVDVGQGDSTIIESPEGRLLIIDGGENECLQHYVKRAFASRLADGPLPCEALVVTHGDQDHLVGLTRLVSARLVNPGMVLHNGLVKAAGGNDSSTVFGSSTEHEGQRFVVGLRDDIRDMDDAEMNRPFREWKAALKRLTTLNPGLVVARVQRGDDSRFATLAGEGIHVAVLGPICDDVAGVPALRFFHEKPGSKTTSASHTINGHSVVLRLTYGNVRMLLTGDVNEEGSARMLNALGAGDLASEVFKVPHHGSADQSIEMLKAVSPVVSVVSSGDEDSARDYIHPRAGLLGALGRHSRATLEEPLVYVTETVAFFEALGPIQAIPKSKGGKKPKASWVQNAYSKTDFGIVHVRTDGKRLVVACHSAKGGQKECYAFDVGPGGNVKPAKPRVVG